MFNVKKTKYDIDTLLSELGVEISQECTHLQAWLSAQYILNEREESLLAEIHPKAVQEVDSWNEEELKMHFIAFLIYIAKIDVPQKIKVFYERPLSGILQGNSISVITDCMIATPEGRAKPKKPYFFLQEFKKQKKDPSDPEGQMLAAMLLAQQENNDHLPLYGSYIMGRNWRFATLVGKNYCISPRQYDATHLQDLYQIVYNLRSLKDLILNR
jgi:hypothetical protein